MKKILILLAIFALFFCSSEKKEIKKITDLLETRKKAYSTNDIDLMMSTYHKSYQDQGVSYEMKLHFYEKYLQSGQNYKFEYSNVRYTKRDRLYYVRYDYKLEKNMAGSGRGYSQSMRDQNFILIEEGEKLIEYGQH